MMTEREYLFLRRSYLHSTASRRGLSLCLELVKRKRDVTQRQTSSNISGIIAFPVRLDTLKS